MEFTPRQKYVESIRIMRDRDKLTFGQIAQRKNINRSTACRIYHEAKKNERAETA